MGCNTTPSTVVSPALVTSTSRPTGRDLYAGLMIFELDTGRVYIYNGTQWVYQSASTSAQRAGVLLTDTAQAITTATISDITWSDAEVSDPDNWISGGIATLTVPTGWAGRYTISYVGTWSSNPYGTLAGVTCFINGVGRYGVDTPKTWVTYDMSLMFTRTLAVGDTIKFQVYHDNGSVRNINSRLEIAWTP